MWHLQYNVNVNWSSVDVSREKKWQCGVAVDEQCTMMVLNSDCGLDEANWRIGSELGPYLFCLALELWLPTMMWDLQCASRICGTQVVA